MKGCLAELWRAVRNVGLAILLTAILAVLLDPSGGGGPSSAPRSAPAVRAPEVERSWKQFEAARPELQRLAERSERFSPGQVVIVAKGAPVTETIEEQQRFQAAVGARDFERVTEMVSRGRVVLSGARFRATVDESMLLSIRLRLMDGPGSGKIVHTRPGYVTPAAR